MDDPATILLTLTLHSVVLTGCALLVARALGSPALRSQLLKLAVFSALATTAAQLTFGWGSPLAPAAPAAPLAAAFEAPSESVPSSPAATGAAAAAPAEGMRPVPLGGWLLVGWGAVAAALLWTQERRRRRFLSSLRRTPFEDVDARTISRLPETVRLTRSRTLSSPIAVHSREICVPADLWDQLEPRERGAALAHEFAHIQRRDPLFRRAASVAGALLFHQPLLRLVRRQEAAAAELDCDAMAARRIGDPASMAGALAAVATRLPRRQGRTLVPAMASAESDLVSRVRALTASPKGPVTVWQRRGLAGASALALTLFACSAPRPGSPGAMDDGPAVVVRVDAEGKAELFAPQASQPRARMDLSTREGRASLAAELTALRSDPDVDLDRSPLQGSTGASGDPLELIDTPLIIDLPADARWLQVQRIAVPAAQPSNLFWNLSVRRRETGKAYPLPLHSDLAFQEASTLVNTLTVVVKRAGEAPGIRYSTSLESVERSGFVNHPLEIPEGEEQAMPPTERAGPFSTLDALAPVLRAASAKPGLIHLQIDGRAGTTVGELTDLLDAVAAVGVDPDMISLLGSYEQ